VAGFFERTRVEDARLTASLAANPVLDLEYERDLCASFRAATAKVAGFLGLPPAPLPRLLRKQATRPVREQVSNYPELKTAFAGGPYARFFDD
jgi:hypothetical protein